MIYGIDIGATNIKIGLFDKDRLIEKWQIETNLRDDGKHILEDIALFINQLHNDVQGYGFGIPGNVVANFVSICPNIKWKNVNVEKDFLKMINKKGLIVSDNDANVAALAEYYNGSGKGHKNIIMLTIGSGIGGGIIINGKLHQGKDGKAGEIGHIKVEFDKPRICGCGKVGCLEAMASAKHFLDSVIEEMPSNHIFINKPLTNKDIFDNAKDEYFKKKIGQFINYLGIGIANITTTLNPDIVIIGGGLSYYLDPYIKNIEESHAKYCYPGLEKQKIVIAKLKNDAGMLGAARLIEEKMRFGK